MGRQTNDVIEAMDKNGGYATFNILNQLLDFSTWKTKTPQASVRRIVQQSDEFFRIRPGLWALTECKTEVLSKLGLPDDGGHSKKESFVEFDHYYYQGILVELGNMNSYETFVPAQDKNKKYLERNLGGLASTSKILDFTYPELLRRAKTVDVIWFNSRRMPAAFFEIEHSTDIKNSLDKYYELQDFRSKFYIVAPSERKAQFEDVVSRSIYRSIREYVSFQDYDKTVQLFEKTAEVNRLGKMT